MAQRDLVHDVAGAALTWVCDNRSGFVLPADVLEPYTDVNHTLKPLGELAQLCTTVRRRTGPGDRLHTVAASLVRFAWEQTGAGELLLDLLRAEPFATYPFEIYAAFAGDGLRHQGFERLAGTIAATRGWAFTEQHANRRLGLLNSERRIGLPLHTDMEPALRRTWLGGLPEPWTFERASGYALTHAAFHVTDWGTAPHRMPHDVAGYLGSWLPAWIDGCFEGGQWDLGCELLAVGACLPAPPPAALVETWWPVIAAVQDSAGAVPETGPPPQAGEGRDGRAGEAPRTFLNCYHSTLVTAFAAALTLARMDSTARNQDPDNRNQHPDRSPAFDMAGRRDGGAV
ncbi:hypothetical protein AB0436_14095 [Streptomyces sp. NPDC051322]|uniref:DUF6895 family protein n=1 Tax=Streptomyces sp. NPDC051322 TaxID=3154645 RepID=UPI00344D7FD5